MGLALFGSGAGFGHHVFHVFAHGVSLGENGVLHFETAADEIGGKRLEIELAARNGTGSNSTESDAAKEEQTVLEIRVHSFPRFAGLPADVVVCGQAT